LFGCGTKEADTTKYCNDLVFGIPTAIVGASGNDRFNPDADSQVASACCANTVDSGTDSCNKPVKCLVGAVGMGTSAF